jgi:hypothetical protein
MIFAIFLLFCRSTGFTRFEHVAFDSRHGLRSSGSTRGIAKRKRGAVALESRALAAAPPQRSLLYRRRPAGSWPLNDFLREMVGGDPAPFACSSRPQPGPASVILHPVPAKWSTLLVEDSSGWQVGHQKVVRASRPCLRDSIAAPQWRHGLPRRP